MLPKTLQRYRVRASNFYRANCGADNPCSKKICAALISCAPDYVPSSFATLKSALVNDQIDRGNFEAAEDIRRLVNPVTTQGSSLPRKKKPKRIRTVSLGDFKALRGHLNAVGHKDELAALVLAGYLGVRPCEMRTITVKGNGVHIIGGKKDEKGVRGADRVLIIERADLLRLIERAATHMAKCRRSDAAISDRLRLVCRALWPRRKRHPTLYTFRHQLGSALKASGESAEILAYIMGHQSTDSIEVYGDRRSGVGRKIYVKPAPEADFSKIRTPNNLPRYGREQVDEIDFQSAASKSWVDKMREVMSRR